MFRIVLLIGIVLMSFMVVSARETSEKKTNVVIKADTEFSAETNQPLGAETAKPGDDFNLTLTADFKGEEGTIVKGSEVFGRVLKVEMLSEGNSVSTITIMFDFIKQGDDFITLKAVLLSIENGSDAIKIELSTTIPGGTILSLKGKNLAIEQGTVLRLKVIKVT